MFTVEWRPSTMLGYDGSTYVDLQLQVYPIIMKRYIAFWTYLQQIS